jgi:hypothetical protein
VDTGDRESTKLPIQEMPLNSLEQRRHRRQDARGENQDWAQPQDDEEERMTPIVYVRTEYGEVAISLEHQVSESYSVPVCSLFVAVYHAGCSVTMTNYTSILPIDQKRFRERREDRQNRTFRLTPVTFVTQAFNRIAEGCTERNHP